MTSPIKYFFCLTVALLFLGACTTTQTAKVVPETMIHDMTPQFASGEFISKVDGWVVLLDASYSMDEAYQGYTKFDIAKAFVKRMNDTLPPVSAVSGLRTFGHALQLSSEKTQLFYGMSAFDRQNMDAGLSKVTPPGGNTPMAAAIHAAAIDLANIKGDKAVIIISDGKDLDEQPVMAVEKMLADSGNNTCIYTVLVGDDKAGEMLMDKIARVSSCGFMVSALDTIPGKPMANYVSKVFLEKKPQALGYHKPEPVVEPIDNILFSFDDSTLSSEAKDVLDQTIKIAMENSDVKIRIEGHASAIGAEDYNQNLSEKRAVSVRDYLLTVGNISSDRVSIIGFGETKPEVEESDTPEWNSPAAKKNRRAELKIIQN